MISYQMTVVGHVLRASAGPRIAPADALEQRFVAWPWRCDANLHLNNAQYLTVMDYGRTAWLGATRLVRPLFRDRVWLVAGAASMTYRRELDMNRRFTLSTRLIGIEPRWTVFEQVFRRGDGAPAASGFVRVAARHRDGSSASDWLVDQLGPGAPGAVQDPAYHDWVASIGQVADRLKGGDAR